MTSIFERVAGALGTLSPAVPYRAEVFLTDSGDDLPNLFITYALVSSPPVLSADNAEVERTYRVQITINTRAGLNSLPAVKPAMVEAGFIPSSFRQLPFDPVSRHFRMAHDYIYLENQ